MRKPKIEAMASKVADELQKSLNLVTKFREQVEASIESAIERGEASTIKPSVLQTLISMVANLTKVKMDFDEHQSTLAEQLSQAEEHDIIVNWVVELMSKQSRAAFLKKLDTALTAKHGPDRKTTD